MQGAPALRQCYERALKKNQSLQYQSGVGLTLDITVRPQGTVEDVGVNPSIDPEMTSCIKSAAMRWKFPTFAGQRRDHRAEGHAHADQDLAPPARTGQVLPPRAL